MVNKYAHVTGGADQNCLALVEALLARGHQAAILSTRDPRNVVDHGIFVQPTVTHQTRDALSLRSQAIALRGAFWNPAVAKGMQQLLAAFGPDVVHVHKLYPQLSVAPIVLAARASVPIVQTLHDYELLSASALDETGGRLDRDETRLPYR